MTVLAVHIGNTHLVLSLLEDGRVDRSVRARVADCEELDRTLREALEPPGSRAPDAVLLSSVRPASNSRVRALLETLVDAPLVQFESSTGVGLVNECREPARVGIDRLLAARAALERTRRDTIVIDFGTAATFNVVLFPGIFKGGLIAPGVGLAADALARGTALLPRVDIPGSPPAFLGRSTEEALGGGIYWSEVGAVERIVRGLEDEMARAFRVLATGGDAERVASGTSVIHQVHPHLVMEGLWHAWSDRR